MVNISNNNFDIADNDSENYNCVFTEIRICSDKFNLVLGLKVFLIFFTDYKLKFHAFLCSNV